MKSFKEFVNEGQVRFSKKIYKDKIPDDVLERLIDIDHTPTKSYAGWIIKGYLNTDKKKLYLEDLYKIDQYLTLYDKLKKKNLIEKDIYKFGDYKDLYKKMKEVGGTGEPDEDENYLIEDRYFINNDEAKIFYEDEDYLIVIPKTYEASKFYANKTEWCTRYPKEYYNYSKIGDLYIVIDKKKLNINENERLMQFHFQENQFMDIDDNPIQLSTRKKFVSIFKNVKEYYLLKFDSVSEFKNDRAVVSINVTGYVITDSGDRFVTNRKYGIIDNNGKECSEIKYDKMSFYQDVFLVGIYNKDKVTRIGCIDKNGKIIIPIEYMNISYEFGSFIVNKKGFDNVGVLDKRGKVVIPCKYSTINYYMKYNQTEGYYMVSLGGKQGVLDSKGKEILPVKYYNVYMYDDFDLDFHFKQYPDEDKVVKDGILFLGKMTK